MEIPNYSRWSIAEKRDGSRWLFRCACGTEKVLNKYSILNGRSRSCGCLRNELLVEQQISTKHGMHKHPAYKNWINMRFRMKNHQGYINLPRHEPWDSFYTFWSDMGSRWFPGATLDRIENNDGYNPKNCRWLESEGQPQNRRCVKTVIWNNEKIALSELSRRNGHNPWLISMRLKAGWTLEDAVRIPSKKKAGRIPPSRLLPERIQVLP